MMKEINGTDILTDEIILNKIYVIRGVKVMLDRDLAELYKVETKYLKRQVRRNIIRFPDDFMFILSDEEFNNWRSQFVTSKNEKMGLRYPPYAFTEDGVAQLSTVLNSEPAIKVNIKIIRMFSRLRKLALSNSDILIKLERLEQKGLKHDKSLELIFEFLKKLEQSKQEETDFKDRQKIGFKQSKKYN